MAPGQLDEWTRVLSGRNDSFLILYYIIMTFETLEKKIPLKTLRKKEKMLVTSIFSFSHNVFYIMKDKFKVLSKI